MRLPLALAVALSLAGANARADECDAMVAKLAADAGVKLDRRTDLGTIHLRHPDAKALSIDCTRPAGRPPAFNATWDGARPSATFYALVGRMGAVVLGKPDSTVEAAAKRCQRAALADPDGDAELHAAGMEFDCSAFRQSGGGTHIAVRLDPKP